MVSQEKHLEIDGKVRTLGKEGLIDLIEELFDRIETLEKSASK